MLDKINSKKSIEKFKIQLKKLFLIIAFPTLLSACSSQPVVMKNQINPPAETMVKSEPVHKFTGTTVGDLVEHYLDLIAQYRKLAIRHDDLVNWINNYNKE